MYSLVGGEQVVVKRGNDTVLRFDENEDTEVAAPNNVVIQAHQGDVNLISTNGKIRIHGAIELGGSDLSGTISDTMDSAGSAGLLSALSVVNGTVKIGASRVVHEGRTDLNGTFTTGNGPIQLGWSWEDKIDVRGTIKGQTALYFGGAVDDENKISLIVDEPTSAYRTIRLPDASGRLVVTAQTPLTISDVGKVILNQSQITTVGALEAGSILPTFGDINIGNSALMAQELTVHGSSRLEGPVLGEVPIFFGRNSTLAADGFVTAFNLRAPSWNNTIYIPDSNGTFVVSVSNPHGFQLSKRGHFEFNYTTFNKTGWLNAGRIIPGFGDINIADESVSANSYRIQSYANSLTLGTVDAMFNTSDPIGYGIRIRSADGDNSSSVTEEAQGRYIHVLAGSATQTNVAGGAVYIAGGASAGGNSTGGDVIVSGGAGEGSDTAGGSIKLTSGTGANQTSGKLTLTTGLSVDASSGDVSISSGQAQGGSGGAISLKVGVGDTGTGGDLSLHAGKTTANNAAGGNIAITAGEASSAIVGTGGEVQISGGSGGFEGGAVSVTSGVGTADDSGSMTIATANSGSSGESGNMTVSTGSTTSGVSGGIAVSTGDSSDTSGGVSILTGDASGGSTGDISFTSGDATDGAGGAISMSVGDGNTGPGGAVTVTAGKTTADSAAGGALTLKAGIGEGNIGSEGGAVSIQGGLGANTGGAVSVTSGVGTADDSGSMTIATADSGSSGESGNMTVSTGSTTSGVSGGIAVSTGDSSDTSGGSAFSQATLPVGPRAISASRPATRLMVRGVRSP